VASITFILYEGLRVADTARIPALIIKLNSRHACAYYQSTWTQTSPVAFIVFISLHAFMFFTALNAVLATVDAILNVEILRLGADRSVDGRSFLLSIRQLISDLPDIIKKRFYIINNT